MAHLCRDGGCLPQCRWPTGMGTLFPMELVKEVRSEVASWWTLAVETASGLHGLNGVFTGTGRGAQGSYDVTAPSSSDLQDSSMTVSEWPSSFHRREDELNS